MTEADQRRPVTAEDICAIGVVQDPQVAPDGSHVAFALRRIDRAQNRYRSTLWLAPIQGGRPRRLTAGPSDTQPRWSANGRFIAFVSDRPLSPRPLDLQGRTVAGIEHATAQ